MDLKTIYLIAKTSPSYSDFKEEIDYRMTGHLRTVVSSNEYELNQLKEK